MRITSSVARRLPATFSDTLIAHMTRLKFTNERLALASLLDIKSIQNMRNEKPLILKSVVAACIGLQLEPIYSMDIIKKSGYSFNTSEKHCAYHLLLMCHYTLSIYECNVLLKSMGFAPLVQNK